MAAEYVNLNEAGGLTRSGQAYDGTAEDQSGEARNFSGRMEASRQGLRGAAGRTFTGVADGHTANLKVVAERIAEQALRAVKGGHFIQNADADADSAQSTAVSAVESQGTALSRPITY